MQFAIIGGNAVQKLRQVILVVRLMVGGHDDRGLDFLIVSFAPFKIFAS